MRRTIRPGLELLEGRALLSGVSAATPGLVASLTAVAGRTPSGAQVVLTFTETNASNHDITVEQGPSIEGFTATRGGKTIWNQDAGQFLPNFLEVSVLKPHQSVTIEATWDGRANDVNPADPWVEGPPLSGTFAISNDLDHRATTATVSIPKAWTVPLKSTHVGSPRPPAVVHAMSAADPLPREGGGGLGINPSSS